MDLYLYYRVPHALPMNNHTYFEAIGFWPKAGTHTGRIYLVGYVLSLALTFGAYFLTPEYAATPIRLAILALAFALAQFFVQLACFLHLSREIDSRDKVWALSFVLTIVLILVVGSVWIMQNLNNRMMFQTPQEMEHYMQTQQGI